jgi:Flp pilus assembly protein TadD
VHVQIQLELRGWSHILLPRIGHGIGHRPDWIRAALLAATVLLAGCQTKSAKLETGTDPIATASTAKKDPAAPSFKRTKELSDKWSADQSNYTLGKAYANSLGAVGQVDQQVGVLSTVAQLNRTKPDIQGEVGRELLKLGRSDLALPMLEIASADPSASWQTLSATGSAYDQQARYQLAREKYQAALRQSPDEPSVMNNLAMSYSLEGNLPKAESVLRDAMNKPGGKNFQRIRQNLALVVGLQGRFDEARKIASEDLPPDQVEANQKYLQEMLSQQNTWAKIAEEG